MLAKWICPPVFKFFPTNGFQVLGNWICPPIFKFLPLKGFQVLGKWICPPIFKFLPTIVHCLLHFVEIMAQSPREARGKGVITPLMLSPSFIFLQSLFVLHLLEVGLQQQLQMLKIHYFKLVEILSVIITCKRTWSTRFEPTSVVHHQDYERSDPDIKYK